MNRLVHAALLTLLSGGCAAKQDLFLRELPDAPKAEGKTVGLWPSTLLFAQPGAVPEGMDSFTAGLFVGNVVHSGGYVYAGVDGAGEVGEEAGLPVRSKEFTLNAEAEYEPLAQAWLDAEIFSALSDVTTPLRLPAPSVAIPAPTRLPRRGTDPADGTDNINLPRFDLVPTPITDLSAFPAGVDWVVAPTVVLYYSHNGGWFIGQRMGTGSGARVRVFWTVYDTKTGAVVSYGDLEARALSPYVLTPNKGQLEDLLIECEEKIHRLMQDAVVR
ncbi:hypothetical protein L6R49_25300 [Myxococcota bacterium]|nr:hypothetical protein [Myxococcota bacterium]